MRRHLVWIGGLGAILAAASIALAAGTTTQTISGKVTPKRLPAAKRVGVSLKFSETTGTTDPSGAQPPTLEAKILFDKDVRLTTRGLAKCRYGQLDGKTTHEAKVICRDSKIGDGDAVARLSNGAGGHLDIPAVVTAFNGKPGSGGLPSSGKPLMILHIVIGSNTTVDVPLIISRVRGAYGTMLSTIHGADAEPIHRLTLSLHRSFKVNGKRKNYVSARCSHGTLLYKGRFQYVGSRPLSATDSQRCKVRR